MRRFLSIHRVSVSHAAVLVVVVFVLSGCSSYAIKGRVIRGPAASVQVVSNDDPRLKESNATGAGAEIQAVLEPTTPTERQGLGRHVSDSQGWFSIPVDAFGSGLLEYEAQIIARRDGNQGVMGTVDLPRRGQSVLITLPLGHDTLVVPEGFLDQTLREAKPYLEESR